MDYNELAQRAVKAKDKSYSPYSKFRVGAALLSDNGSVFEGTNIENASYGLSICAERTAAFNAFLEGNKNFKAIAVASDKDDFISPCGSCRQVLIELCGPEMDVILLNGKNEQKIFKMKELLPLSFTKKDLE